MDKAGLQSKLKRLDHAQRERPWLAIPVATVKKFGEDQSSNLASMIAFWAFFSIFPLLMALVTVLDYVLPADQRKRVLDHISGYLPLLDVSKIGALHGSWLALLVGLFSALWSGLTVVQITQQAFNSVWEVPQVERPKFLQKLKRSLLTLLTLGLGLLVSTLVIGFVTGDNPAVDLGWFGRLGGFVLGIVLDVGLFLAAFRMLTDRDVGTRDVLPGAVFSGIVFWILQSLSSLIITRHLSSAQGTYGTFATVITILWWFYLQSQLTLLGVQVNVVLKERFWPRALVDAPDTDADRRLLEAYAEERTYVEGEQVDTRVEDEPTDTRGRAEARRDSDQGVPAQPTRAVADRRGRT